MKKQLDEIKERLGEHDKQLNQIYEALEYYIFYAQKQTKDVENYIFQITIFLTVQLFAGHCTKLKLTATKYEQTYNFIISICVLTKPMKKFIKSFSKKNTTESPQNATYD